MTARTLLPDFNPRGGRDCPPEILVRLREIDPTADLIYAGRGVWKLGTFRPGGLQQAKAEKMIRALLEARCELGGGDFHVEKRSLAYLAFKLWWYDILLQGFRPIASYKVQGEPTGLIVHDFRQRDWVASHRWDETLDQLEAAADLDVANDKRVEKVREYVNLEAKQVHRHAFRTPKIITPGRRPDGSVAIARPNLQLTG